MAKQGFYDRLFTQTPRKKKKDKMHFKPLHDNTRMLVTHLQDKPVGTVLFKEDLSKVIGLDVTRPPSDGGGSCYLSGAIRQLLKRDIVYGPLPRAEAELAGRGPAIVHFGVNDKQRYADKRSKTASRVAHNAQRILDTIADEEYEALDDEDRVALDATRVTLKMHKFFGSQKAQSHIEQAVIDRNMQLSVNQTLQLLLQPDGEAQADAAQARRERARRRRERDEDFSKFF